MPGGWGSTLPRRYQRNLTRRGPGVGPPVRLESSRRPRQKTANARRKASADLVRGRSHLSAGPRR